MFDVFTFRNLLRTSVWMTSPTALDDAVRQFDAALLSDSTAMLCLAPVQCGKARAAAVVSPRMQPKKKDVVELRLFRERGLLRTSVPSYWRSCREAVKLITSSRFTFICDEVTKASNNPWLNGRQLKIFFILDEVDRDMKIRTRVLWPTACATSLLIM